MGKVVYCSACRKVENAAMWLWVERAKEVKECRKFLMSGSSQVRQLKAVGMLDLKRYDNNS